jgi:hypothetical protein
MRVITDDLEIFGLLEKAGKATFDPVTPSVVEFQVDTYYGMLLFSPAGPYKGCLLFLVEQHILDEEAEKLLLPRLLALPDDHGFAALKNEALAAVERLISRRNSDRLFYDAH